jgi:hypothetical protein
VKPIISAGLLCLFCALLHGQDTPPPAPAPQQTPAPTVAPPDIQRDDPDNGGSVAGFYWRPSGTPRLLPGKKSANPAGQTIPLPPDDKKAPGFTLAIPAGKFNRIEASYFQAYGLADVGLAPINISPFGTTIQQGDELVTSFQLRDVKLVWNYLTYPAPPQDSKFRIKTMWGVRYTHIQGVVDAPLDLGNTQLPAVGTRQLILPVLGLGAEYIGFKHLYLDARASAFALPHRSGYWDGGVNVVVKSRHIEVFGGYQIFYFKTTPQNDQFFSGTLRGPIAGARWMFH